MLTWPLFTGGPKSVHFVLDLKSINLETLVQIRPQLFTYVAQACTHTNKENQQTTFHIPLRCRVKQVAYCKRSVSSYYASYDKFCCWHFCATKAPKLVLQNIVLLTFSATIQSSFVFDVFQFLTFAEATAENLDRFIISSCLAQCHHQRYDYQVCIIIYNLRKVSDRLYINQV